jgi:hypothetical protein
MLKCSILQVVAMLGKLRNQASIACKILWTTRDEWLKLHIGNVMLVRAEFRPMAYENVSIL